MFLPPSMSAKSLISSSQTLVCQSPMQSNQNIFNPVKRNQSFNGFQNTPFSRTPFATSQQIFNITGNLNNGFINSASSQRGFNSHQRLPTVFQYLPSNFEQPTGAFTFSGISNNNQKNLSLQNLHNIATSAEAIANRISGRNEEKYDIRKTASGINKSSEEPRNGCEKNELRRFGSTRSNRKLTTIAEKRFGSLDLRKHHKCYSPTFYSMRCKKHAKKRPIIVTLPKKCFSELALNTTETEKPKPITENLTDSIQITEESPEKERLSKSLPIPAPRCMRKKHEIVYANISKSLNSSNASDQNTSTSSNENEENEHSVTEVEVHAETRTAADAKNIFNKKLTSCPLTPLSSTLVSQIDSKPKLVAVSPKSNSLILLSPQALKNSPVLKVSPNFIKPKTESPKGALSRQIQAKIKPSPNESSNTLNKSSAVIEADDKVDGKTSEHISNVPKMPILNSMNSWSPNITNNNQVCFFLLIFILI